MSYCDWDTTSKANIRYHDKEWGVPIFDDDFRQFEFLMMEVMQCGLNWDLMINKREIFRVCFNDFNYEKIAKYNDGDIERIMLTDGMIRSPRKIKAIISNANKYIKLREKQGSFSNYLWGHSDGKIIVYHKHQDGYIPVSNGLSDRISRDLKNRGFKYLGPTTIYSHLQACGLIHDHDKNCPRYQEILSTHEFVNKRRYQEKGVKFYG